MCGIAGIVGIEPSYQAEAVDVHRMCQTIVHRGPDDEGIYAHGRAGLGMRRLSIIDLSTGHQPIHNEDHDLWVVFNGEIYNFPELRPELEARGHRFYTNSDTEVIVHLYEEYGTDCVKRLRGMFALAVSAAVDPKLPKQTFRATSSHNPFHTLHISGQLPQCPNWCRSDGRALQVPVSALGNYRFRR